MIINVVSFSKEGEKIADMLCQKDQDNLYVFKEKSVSLSEWTKNCFFMHMPMLFICACGIAVRAIAPFVDSKLTDSPVIVMDEKGNNVIPVLSGHLGGANDIAKHICDVILANPVLTTATDVAGAFAVDNFAKNNGFAIINPKLIKMVSAKSIQAETIKVFVDAKVKVLKEAPKGIILTDDIMGADVTIHPDMDSYKKKQEMFFGMPNDALHLVSKNYVIGIGCKKDKSFLELNDFINEHVIDYINSDKVYCMATIDSKKKERGLLELASYHRLMLKFFDKDELNELEGTFTSSSFVESITGTANVCERAAMAAAVEGEIVMGKKMSDGKTIALAKRKPAIMQWL